MVSSIDYLRERFAARGPEIRVVAGHFPLCTTEMLEGEFTTLTMMREPVERTLSYLRHRAQSPRDRDKSLEEIYEDRRHFEGFIHNHMTKMLALSPDELTDGMLTPVTMTKMLALSPDELTDGMLTPVTLTEKHLGRDKESLAAMDAVGHQESFGEFCAELKRRFGWRLGRPG